MNGLLEAVHEMLSFIVEDAHAHGLDKNHITDERFQHIRVDMAKMASDLAFYLDQTGEGDVDDTGAVTHQFVRPQARSSAG
jgi:hypothetical protein